MRNFMTRQTQILLIKRREEIRRQRFQLIAELEKAAGFGDLRENAEYDAAMEKQGMLNREAENLDARLKNAVFIEDLRVSSERVSIGIAVTLQNNTEIRIYVILGCPEDESPVPGIKITFDSPIARKVMCKTIGDVITLQYHDYEVIRIERAFAGK